MHISLPTWYKVQTLLYSATSGGKTPLGTFREGCFSSRIFFLLLRYFFPLYVTAYSTWLLESLLTELGKKQGTFRTSRHATCQKSWHTEIKKKTKKNTHTHTYGMALDSEQTLVSVKLSRTVLKASKVCSPGPQSPRCNSRLGGIVSWAAVFENERKGKTETQLHEGLPVCYCGYFYLPLGDGDTVGNTNQPTQADSEESDCQEVCAPATPMLQHPNGLSYQI